MPQRIREVMTGQPVCLPSSTTVVDAARAMKEEDIGDVLVMDGDRMCGMVTDRDIVVRSVAQGLDPTSTRLDQVCSHELATVAPDDDVSEAVRIMRDRAVRRVPVLEDGRPVGIVSIGDLAMERQPDSALADISAAPGND